MDATGFTRTEPADPRRGHTIRAADSQQHRIGDLGSPDHLLCVTSVIDCLAPDDRRRPGGRFSGSCAGWVLPGGHTWAARAHSPGVAADVLAAGYREPR